MRWFSRTKFSKASWPPFWHSAIRSLSSGATITLIVNHLTILRDKSFETSVKLNAGRIEKLHPCSHHSHHREGAFPKLNRLAQFTSWQNTKSRGANTKHQAPEKSEVRSFKFQKVHQPRSPEFGVWKLELLWDLELGSFSGVWSLVPGSLHSNTISGIPIRPSACTRRSTDPLVAPIFWQKIGQAVKPQANRMAVRAAFQLFLAICVGVFVCGCRMAFTPLPRKEKS